MPEEAKQLAIADIEAALRAGDLQHRVIHTIPLDEIAAGNRLIEEGAIRGSVILSVD
jgi:NADPH:quinone reductase